MNGQLFKALEEVSILKLTVFSLELCLLLRNL
jgi:hypothetical protein